LSEPRRGDADCFEPRVDNTRGDRRGEGIDDHVALTAEAARVAEEITDETLDVEEECF